MRLWILAAALACSTAAQAATVVKCVDGAGKVSFAQNTCPAGTTGASVEVNAAQRPSGDGPAVQIADPSKTYARPKPKPAPKPAAPEPEVVYREVPVPVQVPVQVKPCMKKVMVPYSYSQLDKDGKRTGVAGAREVMVPCNQK